MGGDAAKVQKAVIACQTTYRDQQEEAKDNQQETDRTIGKNDLEGSMGGVQKEGDQLHQGKCNHVQT